MLFRSIFPLFSEASALRPGKLLQQDSLAQGRKETEKSCGIALGPIELRGEQSRSATEIDSTHMMPLFFKGRIK